MSLAFDAPTFDDVDGKVAEAEFFLSKMSSVGFDLFEFYCYFSAFLAATRTITLALQKFKHIPNFEQWYEPHRKKLASNDTAKYFLELRNSHLHGGRYPISGGEMSKGKISFYFYKKDGLFCDISNDVVSQSRQYFVALLEIVYDCYVVLGPHIDPQQHYSKEHHRDIDAAEAEVYGWSLTKEGLSEDYRWHALRSRVGQCQINHLFKGYLGCVTPQPILPEDFYDFEPSDEDKGWIHIPAGFSSIKEYIASLKTRK